MAQTVHGDFNLLRALLFGGDAGVAGLPAVSGGAGAEPLWAKLGSAGIEDGAVGLDALDLSIAPKWAGEHRFNAGIDTNNIELNGSRVLNTDGLLREVVYDFRYDSAGRAGLWNYQPNAIWNATKRGYTATWSDLTGVTSPDNVWIPDMGDRNVKLDMATVADPLTVELTGSFPTTSAVHLIRIFVGVHGSPVFDNVTFEVQGSDDAWVAVPKAYTAGSITFSEPLNSYAGYPGLTPWKGIRVKFSSKSTSAGLRYLYGIGVYAPRSFYNPYLVYKGGDTFYGTMDTQVLRPRTTGTYDIGNSGRRFKHLWMSGNADVQGDLDVGGATTVAGDLTVGDGAKISFGNTTRQMLDLFDGRYAIGVQSGTLYARSSGGFAWHQGGVHSDTGSDAGTGGTRMMALNASGNLTLTGTVDGRHVFEDGAKLDGIEQFATADQTGAEIAALLNDIGGWIGDTEIAVDAVGLDALDQSVSFNFTSQGINESGHTYSNLRDPGVNNTVYRHAYPSGWGGGSTKLEWRVWSGSAYKTMQLLGSDASLRVDGGKVWHSTNDGAGSNLDADKLDGYQGDDFPRKIEAATIDGAWTFEAGATFADLIEADAGLAVTGSISVTGTVDGRDVTADGLKTDGVYSTHIGRTGGQGSDAVTNTAAAWSALPIGYSRMMKGGTITTAGGTPVSGWGYFHKVANRDGAGGWAGLWLPHGATNQLYVGYASTSTTLPTWTQIVTSLTTLQASMLTGTLASGLFGANTIDGASALIDGSVTVEKIEDNELTLDKLEPTSGNTFLGNSSGSLANVSTMTIAQARGLLDGAAWIGATELESNAVTTAKIADNAVTLAKLGTQDSKTILGNKASTSAAPTALSKADALAILGLYVQGSTPTGGTYSDGDVWINNSANSIKHHSDGAWI